MSRQLYQLLLRTKENCIECMKELKQFCAFTKVELPPKYFEYMAIKEFCDFLLKNEVIENENTK